MKDDRERPWLEEKLCEILGTFVAEGNVSVRYVPVSGDKLTAGYLANVSGRIRRCRVTAVQIVVEVASDERAADLQVDQYA